MLAPIENVLRGQNSMAVRLVEGLVPAGASLQALALSVSEYSPFLSHAVHSAAFPPMDAFPARHTSHSVSVVKVEADLTNSPTPQVAAEVHPTAP